MLDNICSLSPLQQYNETQFNTCNRNDRQNRDVHVLNAFFTFCLSEGRLELPEQVNLCLAQLRQFHIHNIYNAVGVKTKLVTIQIKQLGTVASDNTK